MEKNDFMAGLEAYEAEFTRREEILKTQFPYRGEQFLDIGYIYAPYIPLQF